MGAKKRKGKPKRRPPVRFPLRELCRLKGWSQRGLSRACGISPNRIAAIFHGRAEPRWATVRLLCSTMEVDLGEMPADGTAPARRGGAA